MLRCFRNSVIVGVIVASAVTASADTLTMKDGRTLEGKVLSREGSKIIFDMRRGGASMKMTLEADQVESIKEGPLSAPETKPAPAAAAPEGKPEPVAPPVKEYKTPSYYRIPLQGEVGKAFSASYLVRALEDARLRKPTIIVLELDSPGGSVAEVEKLMRAIAAAKRDSRVVALVRQAVSAAAITALAVDEIYMSNGAIFGAATAYQMNAAGMTRDVSEKMKSIWMSTARASAELGGHPSAFADAMIDRNVALYATENAGKKTYSSTQTPGAKVFKPAGKLMTLTAAEAVACGLSAGLADDYKQLAQQLKLGDWAECEGLAAPLAEWRGERLLLAEKQVTAIGQRIEAQFVIAASSDPASFKDYMVYANSNRFTPDSRKKWAERAGKCMVALQRVEKELGELEKLQTQFPELNLEESALAAQKEKIKAIRTIVTSGPPM